MIKLVIYKVEVSKKDFRFFDASVAELRKLKKRAQNGLVIFFDGYDNEERELFEVPEIRIYAEEMLKRCPEIFYYLNRTAGSDRLFLALISKVKVNRKAQGMVHGSIGVSSSLRETVLTKTEEYARTIDDEAYMYWIYMLFKGGKT